MLPSPIDATGTAELCYSELTCSPRAWQEPHHSHRGPALDVVNRYVHSSFMEVPSFPSASRQGTEQLSRGATANRPQARLRAETSQGRQRAPHSPIRPSQGGQHPSAQAPGILPPAPGCPAPRRPSPLPVQLTGFKSTPEQPKESRRTGRAGSLRRGHFPRGSPTSGYHRRDPHTAPLPHAPLRRLAPQCVRAQSPRPESGVWAGRGGRALISSLGAIL